jgi:hypothetical protein
MDTFVHLALWILGAIFSALIGTAFNILFSSKSSKMHKQTINIFEHEETNNYNVQVTVKTNSGHTDVEILWFATGIFILLFSLFYFKHQQEILVLLLCGTILGAVIWGTTILYADHLGYVDKKMRKDFIWTIIFLVGLVILPLLAAYPFYQLSVGNDTSQFIQSMDIKKWMGLFFKSAHGDNIVMYYTFRSLGIITGYCLLLLSLLHMIHRFAKLNSRMLNSRAKIVFKTLATLTKSMGEINIGWGILYLMAFLGTSGLIYMLIMRVSMRNM